MILDTACTWQRIFQAYFPANWNIYSLLDRLPFSRA